MTLHQAVMYPADEVHDDVGGAVISKRLGASVPDFQINISDAVQALGAFTGESYPFVPTGDPCP